jgi:hypothetical protein
MPNASFLERFCVFVREQEHTQKSSAASSGENGTIDLVGEGEGGREGGHSWPDWLRREWEDQCGGWRLNL